MPTKVGIIGGSGLDNPDILKNRTEKKVTTPFGNPSDALIVGEIQGVPCVIVARHGRKHSIMPGNVNYQANIWALKEEGCTHLLCSNACGSLREEIKLGDIVIPNSFIDRTQGRAQTFYDGKPNSLQGVCHLQMEPAFNNRLRQIIIETAKEEKLSLHESGTVVVIEGPRFSSKAESLMYRTWGGDVIGMTTIPEVILAKEAGLPYASIVMATDYDSWKNTGEKVCNDDVMATFKKNAEKVTRLMSLVVAKIVTQNWDSDIEDLKDTIKKSVMLPH